MKIFMFFIVVLMLGLGLLSMALAVWPPFTTGFEKTDVRSQEFKCNTSKQPTISSENIEKEEIRLAEIIQRLDRDEKKLDEILNNGQITKVSGPKQR